jgi:hypothetical protein
MAFLLSSIIRFILLDMMRYYYDYYDALLEHLPMHPYVLLHSCTCQVVAFEPTASVLY